MGNKYSYCSSKKAVESTIVKNLRDELIISEKNFDQINDSFKCLICLDSCINLAPSCGHMGICNKCYNSPNFVFKKKCIICKKKCDYFDIYLPYNFKNKKIKNYRKKYEGENNFYTVINDGINELLFLIKNSEKQKDKIDGMYSIALEDNYKLNDQIVELINQNNHFNKINYSLKNDINELTNSNNILRNKIKKSELENDKLISMLKEISEELSYDNNIEDITLENESQLESNSINRVISV